MFRNRQGGGGFGRGARNGSGQGQGYGQRGGAGFGRGRGNGMGRGAGWQASDPETGVRWNQPLSNLAADVPPVERKSWLENFKAHLTRRMKEVDEELKNY